MFGTFSINKTPAMQCRQRTRTGQLAAKASLIPPRQKRPSISPRKYAAKIDLLRVQDCLAARMKPCEITRHLGKDKAWVSRVIRKLLSEKETAYVTNAERAALEESNRDFDRLIACAMAMRETAGDTAKGVAAIKAASEVLTAKLRFQISTGQIQCRDVPTEAPANLLECSLAGLDPAKRQRMMDELLLAEAERVRAEVFQEMRRVSHHQTIWGGNYFAHLLPASNGWLVWHKNDGLPSLQYSDCEMAWTSCGTKSKVFNCRHRGGLKDSKETPVAHPSQKALEVMKWCVELHSKPGDLVLDPFVGSGTTGVACALLGRRFIGVERDAEYVQIAKRRIALAKLGQF